MTRERLYPLSKSELPMRLVRMKIAASLIALIAAMPATAGQFDQYGAAPAQFAQTTFQPDLIIELGLGVGYAPLYDGSSKYGPTFIPRINLELLVVPGLLDIGGGEQQGGFSFAPALSVAGARRSVDNAHLDGLDDIDPTYAAGIRVGYEWGAAEFYGELRYAFGGAQGLIGDVGINLTAQLTPEFEIVGGPMLSFATEGYMDTYFGVSAAGSAATGGRLAAFDPSGGIKSAGLNLSARYEFMPDTFINANASYTRLVGSAANSPIVEKGAENQFTIGIGLSRRFTLDLF